MPLQVSIIIPTYNQNPGYLQEAIESAVNQTYPKNQYEILVVDDGSTRIVPDDIVAKFKDEKQLKLIKKAHGGIAHTLNSGIKQMKGQYFKWLSSDDALCEDALEILMGNVGKEKEIFYGDWTIMDETSKITGVFHEKVFFNSAQMKKHLWRQFFGNGDTAIIPKSAFKTVGLFDQSLRYYEDYDWWLRAAFIHDYSFVHTGKILARYRMHSNQTTKYADKRAFESMIAFWRMRRNVYLSLDSEARSSLNPPATITSFAEKAFTLKTLATYRRLFGTNEAGRAKVPPGLRRLSYKLLMVK